MSEAIAHRQISGLVHVQRDRIYRSVVGLDEIWVGSIDAPPWLLQVPVDLVNSAATQRRCARQSARHACRPLTPKDVTAPGAALPGCAVQRPDIPSRHAIAAQHNTQSLLLLSHRSGRKY